jgi:hypothetical protein
MRLERRQFDALCALYDAEVRKIALRVLFGNGYYGLDPRENAPSGYDELYSAHQFCQWRFDDRAVFGTRRLFPVYDGGCANTVFKDPVGNMLFRAWHDLTHLSLGKDLSYAGEHAVALFQAEFFDEGCKDICLADTLGQLNFHAFTNGGFVENQRQFVYDYLTIGEERAIVKHDVRRVS